MSIGHNCASGIFPSVKVRVLKLCRNASVPEERVLYTSLFGDARTPRKDIFCKNEMIPFNWQILSIANTSG